jgi:hypothetical protein
MTAIVLPIVLFAGLVAAQPPLAGDRTVQKLSLGKIEIWLTRSDAMDGGLVLKLIDKGVGPRPQSLTLYTGGGDDDGPGTDEIKSLTGKVLEVPSVGKVLRVDFTYQIPGTPEEQTDTTLVGFAGKTRKLLQIVTKKTVTRNKQCKELWETALSGGGDDLDGEIVTQRKLKVIPVRGDDDEPLDKTCVPQKPQQVVYRWNGERFVEGGAEPSPSPSPAPEASKAKQPAETPAED